MSLKCSYCFVPPLTETSQHWCSSESNHRGAEEKQSCWGCRILFFSGCFGSKQYKDEEWSHNYNTALLVNVFTVCCSFYHYYFLQHYYYDNNHDGYTECTVCVYVCVCVQCSKLVFSKEKLGRVNSLGFMLGFGEPPSCPDPSATPNSKESLESLEGTLLLRQVSRFGRGGGIPNPPRPMPPSPPVPW